MLPVAALILAQTEPSPYLVFGGVASLIALGLAFVLRGFAVLNTQIAANAEDHKLCRHLLGFERARVDWVARAAGAKQVEIPVSFWSDPGPPGTPYPNFDRDVLL